jgi:hypothetical protein
MMRNKKLLALLISAVMLFGLAIGSVSVSANTDLVRGNLLWSDDFAERLAAKTPFDCWAFAGTTAVTADAAGNPTLTRDQIVLQYKVEGGRTIMHQGGPSGSPGMQVNALPAAAHAAIEGKTVFVELDVRFNWTAGNLGFQIGGPAQNATYLRFRVIDDGRTIGAATNLGTGSGTDFETNQLAGGTSGIAYTNNTWTRLAFLIDTQTGATLAAWVNGVLSPGFSQTTTYHDWASAQLRGAANPNPARTIGSLWFECGPNNEISIADVKIYEAVVASTSTGGGGAEVGTGGGTTGGQQQTTTGGGTVDNQRTSDSFTVIYALGAALAIGALLVIRRKQTA